MTRIVAAVDTGMAAVPVLHAARALAAVYTADVAAIHCGDHIPASLAAAVAHAGVPLQLIDRDLDAALDELAADDSVAAFAVGARATPGGQRPVGHVAATVASRVRRPVLVVPPQSRARDHFHAAMVAIDPRADVEPVAKVLALLAHAGCAVTAFALRDESSLPLFEDQAHHARDAWLREFRESACEGHEVPVELVTGVAHTALLSLSRHRGADLMVLGWRRDLAADVGAIAREVLSEAAVPVLLVPATRVLSGRVRGDLWAARRPSAGQPS